MCQCKPSASAQRPEALRYEKGGGSPPNLQGERLGRRVREKPGRFEMKRN